MKTHIFATSAFAVLLAATLFCSSAGAQTDIFVRMTGISGASTDDKHKDWIEATMVTEKIQGASSSGSGKTGARSFVESFTITKVLDQSSPSLKINMMQGKPIPEVVIEYVRVDKDRTKYYTVKLKDVVITSMASTIERGVQMEEVGLEFGSIEWTYVPVDRSGKAGAAVTGGWDLKTNKKL